MQRHAHADWLPSDLARSHGSAAGPARRPQGFAWAAVEMQQDFILNVSTSVQYRSIHCYDDFLKGAQALHH